MRGYETSRRDDLLALGYTLLKLLGALPFRSEKTRFAEVLRQKRRLSASDLCSKPDARCLLGFMREVMMMKHAEEPFYDKLRFELRIPLLSLGYQPCKNIYDNSKI